MTRRCAPQGEGKEEDAESRAQLHVHRATHLVTLTTLVSPLMFVARCDAYDSATRPVSSPGHRPIPFTLAHSVLPNRTPASRTEAAMSWDPSATHTRIDSTAPALAHRAARPAAASPAFPSISNQLHSYQECRCAPGATVPPTPALWPRFRGMADLARSHGVLVWRDSFGCRISAGWKTMTTPRWIGGLVGCCCAGPGLELVPIAPGPEMGREGEIRIWISVPPIYWI